MSLRDEFEKAFQEEWNVLEINPARLEEALWATKWMAEILIKRAEKMGPIIGRYSLISSEEIRQLAKELDV